MTNQELMEEARVSIRAVLKDRRVTTEETICNLLELLKETETLLDEMEDTTHEPIQETNPGRNQATGAALLRRQGR